MTSSSSSGRSLESRFIRRLAWDCTYVAAKAAISYAVAYELYAFRSSGWLLR
ncbi:hypothetical protein HanPSC8_Chr02g0081941 [Helianthus annuus]|nr:hypothetical protein HanPSC8_Chr02g0081941 [Helianthus annuus]